MEPEFGQRHDQEEQQGSSRKTKVDNGIPWTDEWKYNSGRETNSRNTKCDTRVGYILKIGSNKK